MIEEFFRILIENCFLYQILQRALFFYIVKFVYLNIFYKFFRITTYIICSFMNFIKFPTRARKSGK